MDFLCLLVRIEREFKLTLILFMYEKCTVIQGNMNSEAGPEWDVAKAFNKTFRDLFGLHCRRNLPGMPWVTLHVENEENASFLIVILSIYVSTHPMTDGEIAIYSTFLYLNFHTCKIRIRLNSFLGALTHKN